MSNNETIEGRESPNRQCYECVNCIAPDDGFYTQCRRGSCFKCRFLNKNYTTWHMDVPKECPCKGAGWRAKEPERKHAAVFDWNLADEQERALMAAKKEER